jgi:hypothetical protein
MFEGGTCHKGLNNQKKDGAKDFHGVLSVIDSPPQPLIGLSLS